MSIDTGLLLPPNEDLDELIRSLKRVDELPAPSQDEDQQASDFSNLHQGNSSPLVGGDVRITTAIATAAVAEVVQAAPDASPPPASNRQESGDVPVVGASVPANAPVDVMAVPTAVLSGAAGAEPTGSPASPPAAALSVKSGIESDQAGLDAMPDAMPARPRAAAAKAAAEPRSSETPGMDLVIGNEAPRDITVSGGSVPENAGAGTVVATLGAADLNAGDSFLYTLTDPSGKFEIVGNEVRVKAGATLDFETASSHDLVIEVIDAAGLSHRETLTIAVTNQNETPFDITVVGGSVIENAAGGTVVATLGAIDPDAGDSFTFTLTDPSGKFEIVGNEVRLKAGATLDFETATSHDLVIEVADAAGLSHSEALTVAVISQNEAPSDITVAGGSVVENAAAGTVVATLGAGDSDAGDSFAYTLTDPSGKFEIVGNEVRLKAGATLDFETAASHDLGLTVTDAGGLSRTETLTIAVTNQSGSFTGTAANDALTGSSEEDVMSGLAGNDTLQGLAGNDTLIGGTGNDTMLGGAGNDIYVVDAAGDVVTELVGQGVDTVQSSVTHTLGANVENLTLTGTAAINATGNTLDNLLTGNSGNNVLSGGAGNDTMSGGLGNDTYVVDAAGDVVTELAGQGTDTVQSSVSYTLGADVENLTLTGTAAINATGNASANTLTGNAGNNLLDGGLGNDTMVGGAGNDIYVVDAAGDVVTELTSQGTDTVQSSVSYTLGANVENLTLSGTAAINATGNTLANVLTGNSADNVLNGGTGNDTMLGGAGNDIYVVDAAGDVATELAGEGTDTVQSSVSYTLGANVENLTLTGTAAINATGNTLDNTLTGNSGNNLLSGGAGNDTMSGGLGNDTYVVDAAGDVVTELAGQGTDTVQSSVSYTLGDNVERLTLTGTAAIDAAGNALANTLTGNAGDNLLDGGLGNDTMVGGAGNDTYVVDATTDVVTELASQGTDTVQSSVSHTLGANVENLTLSGTAAINATGNTLANVLTGNSGNNLLSGGAGNDTMSGGLGNDTYVVDAAGDVVTELAGQGTDTVQSSVTHTLGANVENLTLTGTAAINATGNTLDNVLTGNSGNNALSGGAGNDTLIGGAGNDSMSGGTGDDTYVVDAAGDVVTELVGQGTDTVQSSVTHTLGANVENLTLTGTAAINATGNTLDNTLTGNSGNNVLSGGAGNDTMSGGLGNDTMIGGSGNDIYVVDAAGDVVTELAGQGTDTVQSSVSYTLGADVENLELTGSAAINATGNALDNVLTGNAGDNVLTGNAGNEILIGGDGNDLFVYMNGQGSDVVQGGTGADWTDTIDLNQSLGSLQPSSDWTVTLTSGSIVSSGNNELAFSNDASGVINFADGSKIDFVEIERVQW
jgi:Ca2+-binding RTX toxin-like protein